MYHMSYVTCHMSPVNFHLSPFNCHLSPVSCVTQTRLAKGKLSKLKVTLLQYSNIYFGNQIHS